MKAVVWVDLLADEMVEKLVYRMVATTDVWRVSSMADMKAH